MLPSGKNQIWFLCGLPALNRSPLRPPSVDEGGQCCCGQGLGGRGWGGLQGCRQSSSLHLSAEVEGADLIGADNQSLDAVLQGGFGGGLIQKSSFGASCPVLPPSGWYNYSRRSCKSRSARFTSDTRGHRSGSVCSSPWIFSQICNFSVLTDNSFMFLLDKC